MPAIRPTADRDRPPVPRCHARRRRPRRARGPGGPSLASTRPTWVLAVVSVINSRPRSQCCDRPRAISSSTSSSRASQLSSCAGGGRPGRQRGEPLDQPAGDRRREQRVPGRDEPDRATSCSGRASLSRKPLAPARSAAVDVLVEVEGGQHEDPRRGPRPVGEIRRVASMPSRPGIRTSIRTTSGASARGPARPPRARRPPRRPPRCRAAASRIIRNPARTSAWSSAISTPGQRRSRGPVRVGSGAHREAAAESRAGVERRRLERRPARACPPARGRTRRRHAGPPRPSSTISSPSCRRRPTSADDPARAGPACFSALVSASWTIR